MRQSKQTSGERIVKDIKRKTRKQYSAEEKIRIVLVMAKTGLLTVRLTLAVCGTKFLTIFVQMYWRWLLIYPSCPRVSWLCGLLIPKATLSQKVQYTAS